jgi:hypothetical protein
MPRAVDRHRIKVPHCVLKNLKRISAIKRNAVASDEFLRLTPERRGVLAETPHKKGVKCQPV